MNLKSNSDDEEERNLKSDDDMIETKNQSKAAFKKA